METILAMITLSLCTVQRYYTDHAHAHIKTGKGIQLLSYYMQVSVTTTIDEWSQEQCFQFRHVVNVFL